MPKKFPHGIQVNARHYQMRRESMPEIVKLEIYYIRFLQGCKEGFPYRFSGAAVFMVKDVFTCWMFSYA